MPPQPPTAVRVLASQHSGDIHAMPGFKVGGLTPQPPSQSPMFSRCSFRSQLCGTPIGHSSKWSSKHACVAAAFVAALLRLIRCCCCGAPAHSCGASCAHIYDAGPSAGRLLPAKVRCCTPPAFCLPFVMRHPCTVSHLPAAGSSLPATCMCLLTLARQILKEVCTHLIDVHNSG